ncbi:MAG TPA: D-alanyl-D-alanine carboxypeptidase family protein [Opitutaceae bacterium]|jgi:D-alanyl-D-alanine carboxypeptidase (penicillin-binding protein 5/6)|nr:D-alanyl-D-alanine carboxypeptidase family protein [Opitutaceae bacterium]
MTRRLFLLGLAAFAAGAAGAGARPMEHAYRGAIVMDAATGDVLFADNANEISPPASMTKLMTFAVLDDAIRAGRVSLQTVWTVTPADARVGNMRDSTSVHLRTNERFTVEDLIYAMMIQSANDAAWMVAHNVAGSVPAFVALMNAKARSLGMTRSTFRTPNGFPVPSHRIADGDLTTPHDFALLCRYLIAHTDILRYTSVRSRPFGLHERFPPTEMTNHNHLLGKVPGVDGLKTGFTNGAGFCLSATAHRGGRRLIVVMMDCPDARSRDLAVARLLERGFATLPAVRLEPLAPPAAPSAAPGAPPLVHFSVPG